jgi:hypothetical protein
MHRHGGDSCQSFTRSVMKSIPALVTEHRRIELRHEIETTEGETRDSTATRTAKNAENRPRPWTDAL